MFASGCFWVALHMQQKKSKNASGPLREKRSTQHDDLSWCNKQDKLKVQFIIVYIYSIIIYSL